MSPVKKKISITRIGHKIHPLGLAAAIRNRIDKLLKHTRLSKRTIAGRCGVSQSKVSVIAGEIGFKPWQRKSLSGQTARNRKIIQLVALGRSYSEIANQFGISRQRVHQITRL